MRKESEMHLETLRMENFPTKGKGLPLAFVRSYSRVLGHVFFFWIPITKFSVAALLAASCLLLYYGLEASICPPRLSVTLLCSCQHFLRYFLDCFYWHFIASRSTCYTRHATQECTAFFQWRRKSYQILNKWFYRYKQTWCWCNQGNSSWSNRTPRI